MALIKEQKVSVKGTTLTGIVEGAAVDNTTLELQYLVSYNDVDGIAQQRYFLESQLVSN
jgi:hypothetical protein